MKEKSLKLIDTYSFIIVALSLVFLESILILKGEWAGDFWEHAAVVKELSEQILYPDNPIIKSETPHAFYSPYALLVAAFSRITGLSSIHALTSFAFFNLILFVYSFYRFSKSVFRKDHNAIAALSLLFILFFYGERPFQWSGFYHIRVLNYVLPYPSTFALSLSFLIMARVAKGQDLTNYWNTVIVIFLSAVAFIIHPTTAIFLYIGITALNFSLGGDSFQKSIANSAILIGTSIALSLLWPYYSIPDLLLGNGDDFNTDSKVLYTDILQKNWPLLFALPALFQTKDKTVRFFLLAISLMSLTLVLSYITKAYGLSRLISNTLMFAHFLIAYLVVTHVQQPTIYSKLYLALLGIALIISLMLNRHRFLYSFNVFRERDTAYYERYSFLKSKVGSNDIVLADAESSSILISYSGKAVSSKRPLYWVDDIKDRRASVEQFFNSETSDAERNGILQQYQPDYLLIDHTKVRFKYRTIEWLRRLGKTVYTKNNLELMKIK